MKEHIQLQSDAEPRICKVEWMNLLAYWKIDAKGPLKMFMLKEHIKKYPTEVRMLDVVTVDGVKFFTLSPSSKLLTDVVGSCDAVTAKPYTTRARRATSPYAVVRMSLDNSRFVTEARELRNAASVEHSLVLLSTTWKAPQRRSQAAVNASRHNREIINMTLPAVGEEPSITTRILKMIKKNDPIQIEF